ncbi:MAG: hypothetical protein V3U80_01350 [Flavobacteriaceae bacterium]
MKYKIILLLSLVTLLSCTKNNKIIKKSQDKKATEISKKIVTVTQRENHRYGGWYCPDNLRGFPAVDIKNWGNVPVVNGRMATKKETQNGTSLIFVDKEAYPNAKPLAIKMPKLARYYSQNTKKEEVVIVIQALNVDNDSIVGFRYLNGGNGSAWFDEVKFMSDKEIKNIENGRFVAFDININAKSETIWKVLTKPEYLIDLVPVYNPENKLEMNFNTSDKFNFKYLKAGKITSEFAQDHFGFKYIQIDFEKEHHHYVEKLILMENKEATKTTVKMVFGPYLDDYEVQKKILTNWAEKVKELSEKN